jgi:hypothetical protein
VRPDPLPPAGRPAPRDVTPPALDLSAPRRSALRRALRRGVALTAATGEAGRLVVRIAVDPRTARRLRISRNATGPVVVGRRATEIRAGETVVRVSSRAGRAPGCGARRA